MWQLLGVVIFFNDNGRNTTELIRLGWHWPKFQQLRISLLFPAPVGQMAGSSMSDSCGM